MSKNISRRNFLKGVTASAVGLAGMGLLSGCASKSEENVQGIYTPGTYTATAKGMGVITMKATFDANSITAIELDVSNETENIGFKRTNTIQIMRFYDILKKNNVNVTIRREFGGNISAACGQLRSKKEEV